MEYLLHRQQTRHVMSKFRQILRLSIVHQAKNTIKGYAEYITNKSTLIADVDPNHVLFDRLELPNYFADLKSDLIVGLLLSIKEQVGITHSQQKSMKLVEEHTKY